MPLRPHRERGSTTGMWAIDGCVVEAPRLWNGCASSAKGSPGTGYDRLSPCGSSRPPTARLRPPTCTTAASPTTFAASCGPRTKTLETLDALRVPSDERRPRVPAVGPSLSGRDAGLGGALPAAGLMRVGFDPGECFPSPRVKLDGRARLTVCTVVAKRFSARREDGWRTEGSSSIPRCVGRSRAGVETARSRARAVARRPAARRTASSASPRSGADRDLQHAGPSVREKIVGRLDRPERRTISNARPPSRARWCSDSERARRSDPSC
jgi:hypothetical protein